LGRPTPSRLPGDLAPDEQQILVGTDMAPFLITDEQDEMLEREGAYFDADQDRVAAGRLMRAQELIAMRVRT
jgi:hypothetical protein